MNTQQTAAPTTRKQMLAALLAGCVLMQSALPAYGAVSQLPGVYVSQPDPNVMFTLDDSLSMLSDAIPDFIGATNQAGMPNDSDSEAVSGWGARFPDMWGSGSAYLSIAYYQSSNAIARYLRSSAGNPLYYDRTVTYKPWPQAGDNTLTHPNANITAVNIHSTNPFDTTRTINITVRRPTSSTGGDDEANNYWRATYYVYTGTTPMPLGQPNNALNVVGNFTKVEIKPTVANYHRASTRTDCSGAVGATGCTYDQEIQNFANWLQYYRSRMLMTKGGVSAAFAQQGTNLRVGFGSINTAGVVRTGQGIGQFSGARRSSFFTDLYSAPSNPGGTPLRRAMDDVGKYFQQTDVNNPWAFTPGTTLSPEYDCRRSFHIFSTDGYWNGSSASGDAVNDNDNFFGATTPARPNGTTYAFTDSPAVSTDALVSRFPVSPFRDAGGTSDNDDLSDVAAYYWRNDLRSTIANNIPSSPRDPAYWQRLTTFTVGLGIDGSGNVRRVSDNTAAVPMSEPASSPFYAHRGKAWLADETMRDLLVTNKVALNWPSVAAEAVETGDDLIRAAMVSRGRYFSATNPTKLAVGLASALTEATTQPLSLANLTASSSEVRAGGFVYQATFNPDRWYGRLYAFPQAADGTVDNSEAAATWEASHRLPAPNLRNIYTWDAPASAARPFEWASLNTAQQGHLDNDSTLLDYLRGSSANEAQNGGTFRDRTRLTLGGVTGGALGDIVNGSPIKGTKFDFMYTSMAGTASTTGSGLYSTFVEDPLRSDYFNTIFAGANDGMLHAFNLADGVERFAFVPNSVYSVPRSPTGTEAKLKMLSDPGYVHRFLMDGPPQLSDAFFGPDAATGKWRTVLNSSTGAGARSIFVMDVSRTTVGVTDGFGPSKVLWEFSEANNLDMGHILSYGHVARMANSKWALIFGNGYDSVNGQAKLFILDLFTGEVIKEIAVGAAGGNGLSQPNFTLKNRVAQYIYAGDLKGQLWKIDVSSADPADWAPSFGTAPEYAPLFTTTNNQPIAVMPTISFQHPNGGVMLGFGTGKFFENEDTVNDASVNVNLTRQAIYGIWDKPSETTGFSGIGSLQARTMNTTLSAAADSALTGTNTGTVNWTTQRGWYMLLNTGGERVNVNPLLPRASSALSPLFVVANTPAEAIPCRNGGTARIFALDPITGSAPAFGVFDANRSGVINSADVGYNVWSLDTGVMSLPLFQSIVTGSTPVSTAAKSACDGRTGVNTGGREDLCVQPPTECIQSVSLGSSDTSIENRAINLCPTTSGRISWRQIQ
jgi:type IV pilus assembly protein PilY1